MKASPNPEHPWYREDAQDFYPYVDGRFVDNVHAASEEYGLLFVLELDAWRALPPEVLDVQTPTTEVRGNVELVTWEEHQRRQQAQAA